MRNRQDRLRLLFAPVPASTQLHARRHLLVFRPVPSSLCAPSSAPVSPSVQLHAHNRQPVFRPVPRFVCAAVRPCSSAQLHARAVSAQLCVRTIVHPYFGRPSVPRADVRDPPPDCLWTCPSPSAQGPPCSSND